MAALLELPLPFDVRYLPLVAVGMAVLVGLPATVMLGRWSGWRRLAAHYPDRNTGRGTAFRSGQVAMGTSVYKMGVRFTMDDTHLHIAMSALARPGHRPMSIPWPDVAASGDQWPWFPFTGHPMVRLTLAREPGVRILVKVDDGRRITEGSGGRLAVTPEGGGTR